MRAAILIRDYHQCQERGPGCTVVATEVDHIIPWFEGGSDDPDNLRGICETCHKPKTQAEAQRARTKFARRRPTPRHPLDSLRQSLEGDGVGGPSRGRSGPRTA